MMNQIYTSPYRKRLCLGLVFSRYCQVCIVGNCFGQRDMHMGIVDLILLLSGFSHFFCLLFLKGLCVLWGIDIISFCFCLLWR